MRISYLATLMIGAWALVTEVTDDNIQAHLGRNIPAIITMYAEWCGHCKTFAPSFDDLSDEYAHLQDKIQFLRIDGDKNRRTSNAFDLKYFPTVMYVHGHDTEEIESRDLNSMKKFIKEKTGLTPESKAPKTNAKVSREVSESHVVDLIDDTIEDAIEGKHALVSFTTEWCSYCKRLAPEWSKLAELYSHDSDIVIANVDCTDMTHVQNLVETFDVEAYPTIVYFSSDPSQGPSLYTGPRTLDGFVQYMKEEGASNRQKDGQLDDEAGIVKTLEIKDLSDMQSIIDQVKNSGSKFVDVYSKILGKAKSDATYLNRESERLAELLKGSLKQADRDAFKIKQNIITSLLNVIRSDEKSEL